MTNREIKNRVAIIGCKDFSAENLYSLLMLGAVRELLLIDGECSTTFEELSRLLELIPLGFETNVLQGYTADAANSDIVIIATGAEHCDGESNLDFLKRKVAVVREIAQELRKIDFDGVILVASNPVDVLAQAIFEESGLQSNRIIGSGKCLEKPLSDEFNKDSRYQLEAAKEMLNQFDVESTWCAAMVCDSPMIDNCQPNCPGFGEMLEADGRQPIKISRTREKSPFATGSCVPRICEAILRDERTILPVVAMATGQYGIEGVFLNQPCIIRRNGVEEVITLSLENDEKQDLIDSSDLLKHINKKYLREEICSSAYGL